MFGMSSVHQQLMTTKDAQVMNRTVFSQPDLLCTTSNPRTDRPILFVCEVNTKPPVNETEDFPPNKKFKSEAAASSTDSCRIPDRLLAQHVGELLVHLDRSATPRAILGMTVERTLVRITSLHVNETTLENIQNTEGRTHSLHYEAEFERPHFFYSKPMNYLKKDDRTELVRSLLQIKMMQRKYETEIKWENRY